MIHSTDFNRTRELVLEHGWNTTCYQIVNPGIEHWHGDDSVVGFVEKNGVRVVAGAPVCTESNLSAVLSNFEKSTKSVCYFGAEERVHQEAQKRGDYSITVMGAQPVWSPDSWSLAADANKSLRAQLNRARNKNVSVSEWNSSQTTGSPALKIVLDEWLATRGLPTMHFMVEPETLGFMEDRRVFVAELDGKVVGFTVLCPIPTRNGWLTEQFVRGRGAPNGTVELMVDAAIRQVGVEGSDMVTMGMVPLSRKVPQSDNPWWLNFTMNWIRAHGRRFYNFDGLEWFKHKFHPDRWDPIYAISTDRTISPKSVYAIAAAFTGIPPWLAVLRGAMKGIRQEARWALRG